MTFTEGRNGKNGSLATSRSLKLTHLVGGPVRTILVGALAALT